MATPNMGLTKWDQSDNFSGAQLRANWDSIDSHDHTPGRGRALTGAAFTDGTITPNKLSQAYATPGDLNSHVNQTGAAHILPVVQTLPANPVDGQICRYASAAMLAKGVIWTMRYRAAAVTSNVGPYKWEYMSGPPMVYEPNVGTVAAQQGGFTPLGQIEKFPNMGYYTVFARAEIYNAGTKRINIGISDYSGEYLIPCFTSGWAHNGNDFQASVVEGGERHNCPVSQYSGPAFQCGPYVQLLATGQQFVTFSYFQWGFRPNSLG